MQILKVKYKIKKIVITNSPALSARDFGELMIQNQRRRETIQVEIDLLDHLPIYGISNLKNSNSLKNIHPNIKMSSFSHSKSKFSNVENNNESQEIRKVSSFKKKNKEKKKKEVLFSLIPNLNKLKKIKQNYNVLLIESKKKVIQTKTKKKKLNSGNVPKIFLLSSIENEKRDLSEDKKEINKINQKSVKLKSYKDIALKRKEYSRKNSFDSNKYSRNKKRIYYNFFKVSERIKKIPSQKSIFTKMSELNTFDSKNTDKRRKTQISFIDIKNDLTEDKKEINKINKKFLRLKTYKGLALKNKEFSRKSSLESNLSKKSDNSDEDNILNFSVNIKKIPSQNNLMTKMPDLNTFDSKNIEKRRKTKIFVDFKNDLTEDKKEINKTNKKFLRLKTYKGLALKNKEFSRKSSLDSKRSNNLEKDNVIKKSGKKIKKIKKVPSQNNLMTKMPDLNLFELNNIEKIKKTTKVIRREEYNVNLKKANVTKAFGKQLILIQRKWRKWFYNIYLKKLKKIQSHYKGHLIRKQVKSDNLIVIRFVVKVCTNTRKKFFDFFLGQMKKLIRAIFFQNKIITNDNSVQVNIPNPHYFEHKKKENNEKKIDFENEYEKLYKILGKGNIVGTKNFPRPYSEIGVNLNILKQKNEKNSNQINIHLSKEQDMKYSGKTSQLIADFINKKNTLNKMNNGKLKDFNIKDIHFNKQKLKEEIGDKKIFLKSKNIKAKEFNIIHSQKYINLIKKKVCNQKWNYYSKKSFFKLNTNIIEDKSKNDNKEQIIIKFGDKIKLFLLLIKECIQLNIRKQIFNILNSMEYRIKRKLKKVNHKKYNSFFSLRKSTEYSDNSTKINSNRNTQNFKCDSINDYNGSSSVIFNDESIFILLSNDNINLDIAEKYELTQNEIELYNQQKENQY